MRKAIFIIFLFALILSACARTPIVATTDQPVPARTEETSPAEPSDGAVIVFRRSGGFAGLDEVWTIYADGRLSLVQGDQAASSQEGQADAAAVEALQEQIDRLGFFSLVVSAGPGDTCCDRFAYSLAVTYQGKSRELSAVEGTAGVPDGYWQAVKAVEAFIQDVPMRGVTPL